MSKKFLCSGVFLMLLCQVLVGQEPYILKRSDFDLKGPVQECIVITKYGQEQYVFNQQGALLSAATIFSDQDSETAYYKYKDKRLVEKRVEVYVKGRLDKNASLAHFYRYDSLPQRRVKERIMNYDRVFIDQFISKYDSLNRLYELEHSNLEGRFVTEVNHSWDSLQTKKTTLFQADSLVIKKIDSLFKSPRNTVHKVITAQFAQGVKKNEWIEFLAKDGLLMKKQEYRYEEVDSTLVMAEQISHSYTYNANGNPVSELIKRGVSSQSKKIIYQLDGSPHKNWIKRIVTPDNTYATRRISYFE